MVGSVGVVGMRVSVSSQKQVNIFASMHNVLGCARFDVCAFYEQVLDLSMISNSTNGLLCLRYKSSW